MVDDEADQLKVSVMSLEAIDPGLIVVPVSSPVNALDLLRVEVFDCVVADYVMPEMDGVELCCEAKLISDVPFILYTGRGSEEVAEKAFRAGVDDYVRKEEQFAHYQVLANRVRHTVERHRAEEKLLTTNKELSNANARFASSLMEVSAMEEELRVANEELQASEEELRSSNDQLVELNRELSDSEERFRAAYKQAAVGIEMLSLDGMFLEGNDTLSNILGYTHEELRKLSFRDITDTEDFKREQPLIDDLLKGKVKSYTVEKRYIRKTWEPVWVRVTSSIVKTSEPYRISIIEDITELKEVGEKQDRLLTQLENERRVLQSVMDGAKNMHLVYLDRDFNFVRVNKAYADTCGYKPHEMIGKNHFDLYSNQENEAIFRHVRDTGEPVTYHDKPFEFPDQPERGITFWDWTLDPIKNDFGKVEGLVFSLVETTERRETEEALRASYDQLRRSEEQLAAVNKELKTANEELLEAKKIVDVYASSLEDMVEARTREMVDARERLESFMNNATEAFFIYGKDLRLVDLNPAALALYSAETRREDLLGRDIVEVAPGIEKTPMYEEYKRVLSTGEPYIADKVQVIPSLGNRWASIHAFKMGDNLGIMRRDVSERVRLEERLRETQRLEAIDRISSMVAHDVRSPLTTAAQALYMAKHRPDRAEEMMGMAERNIGRAIEMIEELRENTRLIEPRRSSVDLGALIEDTILEKPIREDVRVESSVGKGLKRVSVDPGLMRRVLENLLSNAADAMPGGGLIRVDARREGEEVLLSVSDTGAGISEEVGDNVFSPLYTTKPKGVGLGLPFCKRAVEAHGGSIGFNSDPGQGTTFTVKIPLKTV
jgi:PAS domain S-box-containing protein